ncbi:MAG: FMN-binding protein [Treponema sp.]|nr:FMN-binding protein [Treponema sp.]
MKHSFFPLNFGPLLLVVVLFWDCAGFKTPPGEPRYLPGLYEGIGQGFRGPIHLLVQVNAAGIAGLEILDHGEDEQIGGAALDELLALVLDTGSPDPDGISGATESSSGFLAALADALSRAETP